MAAVLAGLAAFTTGGCAWRAQPASGVEPAAAPDVAPRPQPRVARPAQATPPAGVQPGPAGVPVFGLPTTGAPGTAPPLPAPGADPAGSPRQGERLIRELQDATRPPPPPAPASLPDRPGMGRPFGR